MKFDPSAASSAPTNTSLELDSIAYVIRALNSLNESNLWVGVFGDNRLYVCREEVAIGEICHIGDADEEPIYAYRTLPQGMDLVSLVGEP